MSLDVIDLTHRNTFTSFRRLLILESLLTTSTTYLRFDILFCMFVIFPQASSFLSRLIGRGNVLPKHGKSTFGIDDIAQEGYLFKEGSWRKTWYYSLPMLAIVMLQETAIFYFAKRYSPIVLF